MLNPLEEQALYELSSRLNVELYMVGVDRQMFLPEQESAPASVSTVKGALAEWVMACLENPEGIPWWTHTHPKMSAFFSATDVIGAHELFSAIKRPIFAFVLGQDNNRHEVIIDTDWLKKNPKPVPVKVVGWSWKNDWRWSPRKDYQKECIWDHQTSCWIPPYPRLSAIVGDEDMPLFDPLNDDLMGNLYALRDGFGEAAFLEAVLKMIR